jgi:hypothetical protein
MPPPKVPFAAPSFVATLRGVKRFLRKVAQRKKKNPGSLGVAIRGGGYCY